MYYNSKLPQENVVTGGGDALNVHCVFGLLFFFLFVDERVGRSLGVFFVSIFFFASARDRVTVQPSPSSPMYLGVSLHISLARALLFVLLLLKIHRGIETSSIVYVYSECTFPSGVEVIKKI